MLIRDVMSTRVVTVRPHMSTEAALALLRARDLACAPVVTAEGDLWGVVTLADLVPGATVGSVMTAGPATVPPYADMRVAEAILRGEGLPLLPVVDKEHLVGVITRRDVARYAMA